MTTLLLKLLLALAACCGVGPEGRKPETERRPCVYVETPRGIVRKCG